MHLKSRWLEDSNRQDIKRGVDHDWPLGYVGTQEHSSVLGQVNMLTAEAMTTGPPLYGAGWDSLRLSTTLDSHAVEYRI